MAGRGGSYYRRAAGCRARKRRVQGDRAFRKLIGRCPAAIREEMIETLNQGGDAIAEMQRADATSSRARAAISKRVLPGALQLKVGLVGRPLNRRLWWTRVIEKGRKGQTAVARARRASGSTRRLGYNVRVRARAPHPFIYSARVRASRETLGGRLRGFWERTLARASQGATDD